MNDSQPGTVTLENVYYYEVPISGGLPMHIPDEGTGYLHHKKAILSFSLPTGKLVIFFERMIQEC